MAHGSLREPLRSAPASAKEREELADALLSLTRGDES
jgi:hypothetical protein